MRFSSGEVQVCKSRQWTSLSNLINSVPVKKSSLPRSCLDAKLQRMDKDKGNGLYWINPSGKDDLANAYVVYCDMNVAGGGWTLVAKITNDYAWICPERKGASCFGSNADKLRANLFHPSHARDYVDLRISSDENSGIHLKKTITRKLFEGKDSCIAYM